MRARATIGACLGERAVSSVQRQIGMKGRQHASDLCVWDVAVDPNVFFTLALLNTEIRVGCTSWSIVDERGGRLCNIVQHIFFLFLCTCYQEHFDVIEHL